jgi:hypothetical protein
MMPPEPVHAGRTQTGRDAGEGKTSSDADLGSKGNFGVRSVRALHRLGEIMSDPNNIPGRRSGDRGAPVEFYARWVDAYLAAMYYDRTRPLQWLAAQSECAGVKESTMSRYLMTAEALGLIENRTHGRPGGTMTQRCRDVLVAAEARRAWMPLSGE